jgi:hypothetical protein
MPYFRLHSSSCYSPTEISGEFRNLKAYKVMLVQSQKKKEKKKIEDLGNEYYEDCSI